jgi:hypothetical protein
LIFIFIFVFLSVGLFRFSTLFFTFMKAGRRKKRGGNFEIRCLVSATLASCDFSHTSVNGFFLVELLRTSRVS